MKKQNTILRQGVERSSIVKILNVIREANSPLALSEISQKASIHFNSVRSAVDLLSNFNQVDVMSNGNVTLVQIKKGESKNATN